MSFFICPVCGESLENTEKHYICKNNHSFDKAKQGYVNLMPTDKPHANAGDNKDMMTARTTFLNSGAYAPLCDALKKAVLSSVKGKEDVKIIDAGCGEGYYTSLISEYLTDRGADFDFAGIDVAKLGIKTAAKRDKKISYAVAGIYNMPFSNNCADVILNIFAPVCEKEFARTLKHGGTLFIVGPGKNHLFGLKKAVYDTPYLNEENTYNFEGFENLPDIRVEDKISVTGENIHNLFTMTPYYFNTPQNEAQRLEKLNELTTPIDFVIKVLKKI